MVRAHAAGSLPVSRSTCTRPVLEAAARGGRASETPIQLRLSVADENHRYFCMPFGSSFSRADALVYASCSALRFRRQAAVRTLVRLHAARTVVDRIAAVDDITTYVDAGVQCAAPLSPPLWHSGAALHPSTQARRSSADLRHGPGHGGRSDQQMRHFPCRDQRRHRLRVRSPTPNPNPADASTLPGGLMGHLRGLRPNPGRAARNHPPRPLQCALSWGSVRPVAGWVVCSRKIMKIMNVRARPTAGARASAAAPWRAEMPS